MVTIDDLDRTVAAIIGSRGSDLGPLADEYRHVGVAPPSIVLDPGPDDIPLLPHRELLALWRRLIDGNVPPHVGSLTPFVLAPFLGRLVLLDPVAAGEDFRYRLYGVIVADYAGFDLTGKLLSEVAEMSVWPMQVHHYYLATYRAVLRARLPLYSSQRLTANNKPYVWQRLLVPFAGNDGSIARLVMLTIPCSLQGEPLEAWEIQD